MSTPKYNPGDIIDLRFTNNSMPDRIYISMVYKKNGSTEWMYEVLSEKNDRTVYMAESQIDKIKSKKESKCYEHELIQKMYNSGFRFCGNNKAETAHNRANKMTSAKYIKHIILCDAIDENGDVIDGYLGLWVQYNTVITNCHNDDGGKIYYIK